jgi:hypothetical protein
VPTSLFSGLDDHVMSDNSDHSCDADVARSGATSNHNSMHDLEMSDISNHLLSCDADVVGSGATCNRNSTLDQEMSDISDPLLSCDADVVVQLLSTSMPV